MSAATISVNKKLNDGTLISVGGTSYDDFFANLVAAVGVEVAEDVSNEIRAALTPTAAPSAGVAQVLSQATNVIAAAFPQAGNVQNTSGAPGDTPPLCDHGLARKYITGEKNGKAWAGWFCPQPKGQTCPVQWGK